LGEAVFKKITVSLIGVMAALSFGLAGSKAQFAPAPSSQQPTLAQANPSPDDPRLVLMIRNAIIALNQANLTGNYSVLRDLGTPAFQTTNSSARLAESFSALRGRQLDISPIMFYNPKFLLPPALQDGQVLRLTGFFPTTPEQVNFDLAFQLAGPQWRLAGIAVNVVPLGDNSQASAAPPPQPSHTVENSEVKPVHIDLGPPAAGAPQPVAPKKPVAKKPPTKHTPTPQTAAVQPTSPAPVPAADPPPAQTPVQGDTSGDQPASPTPRNPTWNPFGR
jgi:hypothetical protein